MKQQGWKGWWRAAGVRAIKTMAQTAVATIGAAAVLCEVSWMWWALLRCWRGCCPC